jgi:hypothetical protein
MASTTLPNLPPWVTFLPGNALVWVNINGNDYRTTVGAIAAIAGGAGALPVLSADPAGGFVGQMYFNSTIGNPRIFGEDSQWHTIGYI